MIGADLSEAAILEERINEFQTRASSLRRDANATYQSEIETAVKDSSKEREKLIEGLKEKIDQMTQKSNQETRKSNSCNHNWRYSNEL